MSVKKISTSRKVTKSPSTRKASSVEELKNFEQFVSRKPVVQRSRAWMFVTLLIVVIVLAFVAFFTMKNTELQKDFKFKAVYMDGGQVYYAKVVKEDALNLYLDEVYYIQTTQQTIPATEEDGEPQVITVPMLIPRGDELHKPVGYLQINRDKVIAVDEVGLDSELYAEIQRIKEAMAAQPIQ